MKLKGSEKRIVCMKSAGSRLFCEAFFVLREDARPMGEADMLAEANRILDENLLTPPRRAARARLFYALFFLCGAALSALGFLLAALF